MKVTTVGDELIMQEHLSQIVTSPNLTLGHGATDISPESLRT
jgi:hypothetical protein